MLRTHDFDPETSAGMDPEQAHALLQTLAGAFLSAACLSDSQTPGPAQTPPPPDAAARYKLLVEGLPAIVFTALLDQGLSEAYVSPHVETALGFTQEQWLNDPIRWFNQIHPDDRTRWSIEAAQLLSSGQPLRSVYRVLARDGHVVWFHCQAKLALAENGQPWFLHGVAFDITDLKEAELALREAHEQLDNRVRERTRELEQANRQLQLEVSERKRAELGLARTVEELTRSNADLRQFAFSASHDLQEPLRNVANLSGWLKARYHGKFDAEADRFLSFLTEGAQRMLAMIRDLLEYTLTASPSTLPPGDITEAGVTLADVTSDLRQQILDDRATITHEPLPALAVREIHLRQIFQNLLANALKYQGSDPPRIHISANSTDGVCRLSVADNGKGIAREFHEKIFGIFTRLEKKDHSSSTGIGLAICKRIVERYGGQIWVESEPQHGATFRFTLPLA